MSSSASATSEALLILGASVRAATQSAQRAGFKTCGIDLFNDADLRKCGESAKVDDYGDLSQAILQFSPLPFVFTGGLENYSNLLSQISQRHQLLGCSPEVIRRVTDHQQLFVALQQHGFQVIPWSSSLPPHLPEQRWLSKPRKSCGGFNIHFAAETVKTEREPHGDSVYFQEYREGRVIGAVYIASGDFGEGEVSFVGATEQLNGVVDSPDQPFRYCGSAGPLELPRFMEHELSRLGRMLAKEKPISLW